MGGWVDTSRVGVGTTARRPPAGAPRGPLGAPKDPWWAQGLPWGPQGAQGVIWHFSLRCNFKKIVHFLHRAHRHGLGGPLGPQGAPRVTKGSLEAPKGPLGPPAGGCPYGRVTLVYESSS